MATLKDQPFIGWWLRICYFFYRLFMPWKTKKITGDQSDLPNVPDKEFTYDMRERIRTGTHLTEKYFIESIMKNNLQFTFYWDGPMGNIPVVKCKTKPGDMPIFGIYWREYTPEN